MTLLLFLKNMSTGKTIKKHKRKTKLSFLLLEVLIATFIASCCLFLIFQPHVSCLQEEIKLARKVDFERLADISFLEVYQNILEEGSSVLNDGLKSFKDPLYYYWGDQKNQISRAYEAIVLKGSLKDEGYLVKINVVLNYKGEETSYTFNVFLKGNKVLL